MAKFGDYLGRRTKVMVGDCLVVTFVTDKCGLLSNPKLLRQLDFRCVVFLVVASLHVALFYRRLLTLPDKVLRQSMNGQRNPLLAHGRPLIDNPCPQLWSPAGGRRQISAEPPRPPPPVANTVAPLFRTHGAGRLLSTPLR